MKKYTITHWAKNAPPAYVSNGLIGFRFGKNAFLCGDALAAGYTAVRKRMEVESPSFIPSPQIAFEQDGKRIEPDILEQSYDFSNGELTTVAMVGDIRVEYMLYASRSAPSLLISELKFTGKPCSLTFHISYTIREKYRYEMDNITYFEPNDQRDGKCLLISGDATTSLGIAYKVFPKIGSTRISNSDHFSSQVEVDVTPDGTAMDLITAYIPSLLHSEPHNQAQRMLNLSEWQGSERLRAQNRAAWAKIWESRITVEGAKEGWQDAIDASYFYLMTSISENSPLSAAPFGLSDRCYEGHAFWDTESFMFVYPLLANPRMAKNMLDYRFKRVEAARNNARINGYAGIQFPWQSGVTGDEVTVPWATEAGEHHINMDVALAFDAFVRVSGDEGYLKECAWPVMKGVAEWIESRVERSARGYEILHITGADEETPDVNNDSYSNILAGMVLRAAAAYSKRLGYGEKTRWLEIANGLYVPKRDGILLQYEGQPDSDSLHAAPLLSYFPYGYSDTAENDRKTLKHYIPRMEKYCNYPMISTLLGIFPAWIGDAQKSLEYYDKTFLTFFCEPFYACTEYRIQDPADRADPKEPLRTSFITSRGALLMGLAMGLTKMCPWRGELDGPIEAWFGENITLPEGWTKLTVGKIYLRGKAYRLIAEQGAPKARLEALD